MKRKTQDQDAPPKLRTQHSELSTQHSTLRTLLAFPDPSLILLIGPSGAGKSTFATTHFQSTEIVSSDRCRALICDDEGNQDVNREAFELLHHITSLRLRLNRLTVIDATNLLDWARAPLLKIAKMHGTPVVAVVFKISLETALVNNRRRDSRIVDEEIIKQHFQALNDALPQIGLEGYRMIYSLNEAELETIRVVRETRSKPILT